MFIRILVIILIAFSFTLKGYTATSPFKLHTESVAYTQDDTKLSGYLAYDENAGSKLPGVLIVHEWWGLNDHAKRKAEALATQGYVAFALDMYGEEKRTDHPEEATEWYNMIIQNMPLAKRRFLAAYELLQSHERVDDANIAAMGFCFGGWTVLSMAQSGVDLRGVVSFHGSFPVIAETQSKDIKAKILICHGANDSFVTSEQISSFQDHMDALNADWQMNIYGGTEHSFTSPEADERGIEGIRYNPSADRRSWAAALYFFREIFEP